MATAEKRSELTFFTPKPEAIYNAYNGPFGKTLSFNDDCLEQFREKVGRMKTSLIIQALNASFRGILVRPLPYYKFQLPDPHTKTAVLTISPFAIDINIQDIQRSHNGDQTFYKREFISDLRRAVVNGLRMWGKWEIDHQDNNFIQKLLRKSQLDGFLKQRQQQLFRPS